MKQQALRALTLPRMRHLFWPFVRQRASVFMLHRFQHPDLGIAGHDPRQLARSLEELRRRNYDLISLEDLFRALADGRRFDTPAVAFTIDDGYADQAAVGAPVFAAYDCPVTTFVTSGFLDGQLWFWWDRIEHVFRQARKSEATVMLGRNRLQYRWAGPAERAAAQADFTEQCKRVVDTEKLAAVEALAGACDVNLPDAPPPSYAPMTWDDLRRCESAGMTFGPHTVTHPVLSRTPDAQSEFELAEGWRRLRAEATHPVNVFCYPNGQQADFGTREMDTLASLGFIGAVVGTPGYADGARFRQDRYQPFQVRRFSYPEGTAMLLQATSGVERVRQLVRREG